MSPIKIDMIGSVVQKKLVQQDNVNKQAQPKKEAIASEQSGMSQLLGIVKDNPEKIISKEKIDEIKEGISYDLYKPDLTQLIERLSTTLIAEGFLDDL